MIIKFSHPINLLLLICVAKETVTFHPDHALADIATILETLTNADGIRFPHCTLSKEFLSTASSVYGCQRVVEQNPICNRSLVVSYSQLEPLVYQNESGHVVGILPGIKLKCIALLIYFRVPTNKS